MPRKPLIWGAGLSPVLQSLPAMAISLLLVPLVPSLVMRNLSPDMSPKIVGDFLNLPATIRIITSLLLYSFCLRAVQNYQRRADRRRLGPDVEEVPRAKLNWPWNLDIIVHIISSRETDYCAAPWVRLVEEHGNTFNLGLFGGDQIVTVEPEHIKAILSTDFDSYEKGADYRRKMLSVLGRGVFNSDGMMWKHHRKIIRPYFSRYRISDFDNFARHSDIAISKILTRLAEPAKKGTPTAVDFQDLAARFSLDSGTEFLFGQDVKSLEAPLLYPFEKPGDNSSVFATAFNRVQEHIAYRFGWASLWPWLEMFWDRTAEDMRVIDNYISPILRRKYEEKRVLGDSSGSLGKEDTLLDHIMRFTDDEAEIKEQMINVLMAARDTTSTVLTFAVYMLATHPGVMDKLRGEVITLLGTSNHPTSGDIKEMRYMRAVLDETMRLFPPVPMNERTAVKSTVLYSHGKRYYVPAGASMPFCTLHMHRRKDLWGPDADEFDPERWLDERFTKYVVPNPSIFMPFSAGPRVCLGRQFAYNELSYFLSRLLQRIDCIELVPEAHPEGTLPPPEWKRGQGRMVYEKIWPKSHLNLFSNGGLWVNMKEAKVMPDGHLGWR